MKIFELSPEYKASWNALVQSSPYGHLLQTWEYGDVRQASGTKIVRIGMFENNDLVGGAQLSIHPIPRLAYTIGYIARGPVLTEGTSERLTEFLTFIKNYAKDSNMAFIKLEPYVTLDHPQRDIWLKIFKDFGILISSNPRFMNATSIIDLTRSEEYLLSNCRKNTRYYIRKATKEKINIREAESKRDLKEFYSLLKETASRQNFSLAARPLSYFENMWDHFHLVNLSAEKAMRVYFAEINNKPVATILNLYAGNKAYYPYGASSIAAHGTAATEGLMWHSIMQAKQAGCTTFDLWGVLATEDTDHPYWGYTFFKNGFGGETVKYIGSFDFPTKPFIYKPLLTMEKLRRILLKWKII